MKTLKKEITVYRGDHGQKLDDKIGVNGDLFIRVWDYNLAVYCKMSYRWVHLEGYTMGAQKTLEKEWGIEL